MSNSELHLDLDRQQRTGMPEAIFAPGKTVPTIIDAAQQLMSAGQNVLITRIEAERAQAVAEAIPSLTYREKARIQFLVTKPPETVPGTIAILAAGTADLPVAEEAAETASFLGSEVRRFYDVGVAGLHRLLGQIEAIREAQVVIVVAGMDGALPSVVGGLVSAPVIACPTSVGYGANFQGLAPLLTMLNACSSGVSVVNIDNGFGAAVAANRILKVDTLPS